MINLHKLEPVNQNKPTKSAEKATAAPSAASELRISGASFPSPFYEGLLYSPPARGTWTIAHSSMLIPGSLQIFACASCCVRGVVLSAEEMNALDRFAMIELTDENIIKGNLEEMIIEGTTQILNERTKLPTAVLIYTSCIQHFLNIDLKVTYRELRRRFPQTDFIDCYMLPTMRKGKFNPDTLMRRQLYRAVGTLPEKKNAVNIIGNYEATDSESELLTMFREGGYEVRDLTCCRTYADYKHLGEARSNLYFVPAAKQAADDLERRLSQKAFYVPAVFDYEEITENETMLSETFGLPLPDFTSLKRRADEALLNARYILDGMPVVIDYTATPRPLSLARLLFTHGFRVHAVYADAFVSEEQAAFDYLKVHAPSILLRPAGDYKLRFIPRNESDRLGRILAIGQKAAYYTGTDRFVNLIENGGLYGFEGIIKLAGKMAEAAKKPADVMKIIQVKAWGCGELCERQRGYEADEDIRKQVSADTGKRAEQDAGNQAGAESAAGKQAAGAGAAEEKQAAGAGLTAGNQAEGAGLTAGKQAAGAGAAAEHFPQVCTEGETL